MIRLASNARKTKGVGLNIGVKTQVTKVMKSDNPTKVLLNRGQELAEILDLFYIESMIDSWNRESTDSLSSCTQKARCCVLGNREVKNKQQSIYKGMSQNFNTFPNMNNPCYPPSPQNTNDCDVRSVDF